MSVDQTVDVNAPRFDQGVVAAATAVAYLVDLRWLVGATFVVQGLSALGGPRLSPLFRLYAVVIRPVIQPDGPVEFEPSAPHRFAQAVAAVVLGLATAALSGGWTSIGWAAVLLVTVLSALAAVTPICVGCIVYERTIARGVR